MKKILGFKGEYRFLSNFWPSPIFYKEKNWPTAEHAYQAMKSKNESDHWDIIIQAKTPYDAKKMGKNLPIRNDWNSIKEHVMYEIVYCKFSQNEILKKLLLNTKNSYIEETNHWGDTFWGVCDGVGKNKLGNILMKIREELEIFE